MLRRSALNRWIGSLAIAIFTLTGAATRTGLAQEAASTAAIVSSQFELSGERARLQLALADGRSLDFTLRDGQVWIGNRPLGAARRGEELDRAWRDLLARGMDTPTEELAGLLTAWSPPAGGAGAALRRELSAALSGSAGAATASAAGNDDATYDTVAALQRRIAELEQRLDEDRAEVTVTRGRNRGRATTTIDVGPKTTIRVDRANRAWYSPLRHIGRGFVGILSNLVVLAVLVGIGFAVVYFGRSKLEAVADTARNETLRSGLVGLAATFLILPGYVLGIVALAISIVGIPLLLAWVPLYWVAVGIAALFGYLAVGHAIGEGLAERRFYGGEWARRANSYYYVLTGLAALFALFIASHAVQMAGPWLGFIRGLLTFLAVALTWAAFTIGLGAVLLTRAGTRPRRRSAPRPADLEMGDLFEEESHV
jgi:hypothetical protein